MTLLPKKHTTFRENNPARCNAQFLLQAERNALNLLLQDALRAPAFLDVSSLNLAALSWAAIFLPKCAAVKGEMRDRRKNLTDLTIE
ncbi:MAG: hypothetical protein K6U10_03255 [Acidobacteriia bacterium]|nr:hypothetical protein [Methyloceanibacter sp.]MBX5472690.1 hypothetical protein [Acetobacteraceae bacterium]MCL6490821.1 hypothetical protein [Terriglobia bacterium]